MGHSPTRALAQAQAVSEIRRLNPELQAVAEKYLGMGNPPTRAFKKATGHEPLTVLSENEILEDKILEDKILKDERRLIDGFRHRISKNNEI
jgi:hypothetical protein